MVSVRWFDSYLEEFEATEVRFGSDILFLRLADGKNRHIPLRSVRWFGMSVESNQSENTENVKEPKIEGARKPEFIEFQKAVSSEFYGESIDITTPMGEVIKFISREDAEEFANTILEKAAGLWPKSPAPDAEK